MFRQWRREFGVRRAFYGVVQLSTWLADPALLVVCCRMVHRIVVQHVAQCDKSWRLEQNNDETGRAARPAARVGGRDPG